MSARITLRKWTLFLVSLSAMTPFALASKHPGSAELLDRLSHAQRINSLITPDMKPWLLKVNFQRFDAKGKLIEHGVIAEWWLNPDERRIEVALPGRTQTFVYTQGHEFHSPGADLLPDSAYLLLPVLTDPMQDDNRKDLDPPEAEHAPGSGCIVFRRNKSRDPELGYCLTPQDALESNMVVGPLVAVRRSIKIFQGHYVPGSMDLSDGKSVFYSTQLTGLAQIPASSVDLSTDKMLEYPDPIPPHGTRLPPARQSDFPHDSGQPFGAGTYVLRVITGRDGHVRRVDVLYARDQHAADDVADEFRRWARYPTVYEGKAVERDETLVMLNTVNVNVTPMPFP